MPVPTHFKFTVRGFFDNSPEAWSFGFKMKRDAEGAPDADLGDIDESAVTAALTAFIHSTMFCNNISVEDWRAYDIGTDGHMEGNAPLLHAFGPGVLKGNSGAVPMAPQNALVVSLISANKGPAKRGRMYLPGVITSPGNDWLISDTEAATFRTATTTFLKSVSDAIDLADIQQSAGVNVSPGPVGSSTGTIQEIDHLEVGRVIDTVRNRRKSLDETYNVGGHIDW
jgi:hypothetical protein